MSINSDCKRKEAGSAGVDIRTLFCPTKKTCEQVQSDPSIVPSLGPPSASAPASTSEPSQKEIVILEERGHPSNADGLLDAEFID